MSFDGIFTYGILQELSETLVSGRISKIYQPFPNELILQVRAKGENRKLLISAHPNYSRVHFTNEPYENPSEPPMFCMLLRKHLEGSIIEQVYQLGLDRILVIETKGRNEIGDVTYKQLIIEIMGRHSNVVLVDKEKQTIIDSIKHVPMALNRHRTLLPGAPYVLPPSQDKLHPFEADEETVVKKIDFNSGKLATQLVQTFSGLSPLIANEVVFRSGLANRSTLPKSFVETMTLIKEGQFTPTLTTVNQKDYFYLLELTHLEGTKKTYATISQLLDRYYYGKAERDRVKQQAHDLVQFISTEKKKNEKKIKKLEQTLQNAEKASDYQLAGELLTANLHLVKKGDAKVDVINYYDENSGTLTISLDPQKSPSQNAQSYFTKYQKAKNSVSIVIEQIEKANEEVQYFESLIQQMDTATHKDIAEIREELVEEGYLRNRQQKQAKKQKNTTPTLEQYVSSDGTTILVGKNNKQNEYLTNRLAARDDVWFHTKDIPGSHVVIRSQEPSEETILEAAHLAAYFSKAKNSSSVPVDYTKIRHVKKPSGAKPGFVTYDNQQTVYVTPSEELVLKLRQS
ncbi:Rqc2 family fibronectin-binding protein [Priestia megaterium]|uniref:Rqc2 family fibronectin-binding protein n=1 Tax=Priestia megaterium TaxID=1404 RepID=UPI001BEAC11B|nr:NFACT RNA binding domain-containing protein [Priestia megaterium]MBT2257276.1 NFACT family protein [Priestia megaterium]MBT2276924.1 NFACT family protein [Priestia megaterium]